MSLIGSILGGIGKVAGGTAKGVVKPAKQVAGVVNKPTTAPARQIAGRLANTGKFSLNQGKGVTTTARTKLARTNPAKMRIDRAREIDKGGGTQTEEPKDWRDIPAPALPQFSPDYGVQAAPPVPTGGGLRPLLGMKEGSSIIGGNPLHYHTHKAGQKVPKSTKPKMNKIGNGKRSSKATCHYKSK